MEEEKEKPNHEDHRIEDEEPERILPSLLEVDLHEFGFKDREVLSVGELRCEFECEWMIARRKFKPTPIYLDLSLLVALFGEIFFEFLLVVLLLLLCDFCIWSLSVDFLNLLKGCFIERVQ